MHLQESVPNGTVLLHIVHDARADPECPAVKGVVVTFFKVSFGHILILLFNLLSGVYQRLPGQPAPHQRKRAGRERPPLFCRCIGTRGVGL